MKLGTVGRQFGVLVLAVGLVACGGSGFGTTTSSSGSGTGTGTGTGSGTGTGTSRAKAISLIASSPQLLSSATTPAQGVTLTAIVKDQNNNVLPNAAVQFVAKRDTASDCGTGGTLQAANATTDSSGSATAILYTGGDPTNQLIDVSATTVGVAAPATVIVSETGTNLKISGPSALGLSATGVYTITLGDAGNNPIGGKTLSVISKLGNGISSGSMTTDANGQVNVTYTASNGGVDTLTASFFGCASFTSAATQTIQVATQNLSILAPNANSQIPFSAAPNLSVGAAVASGGAGYVVGDSLTVQGGTFTTPAQLMVTQIGTGGAIASVTASNAGNYSVLPGSPAAVTGGTGSGATFTISQNITAQITGGTVGGQIIEFSTTRGSLLPPSKTATTNGSGIANVTLNQPSAAGGAGGAVVTATCTTCSPQIATSVTVQFNATTPASVTLQASPSTVPLNGTSAITTSVRDAKNNPVANQPVQFTLVDDSGGTLLQASATTDSGGQAVVTYKAGGTTGSANGVTITAQVTPTISGKVSLTVGGLALRISLGTGNTITALNSTQYQLPYSVLVTDSAGNPPRVGSVVTLSANAVSYQKGSEVFSTVWAPVYAVNCTTDVDCKPPTVPPPTIPPPTFPIFGCLNEDRNLNGVLDPGEDYNGNGVLDPGNVVSVLGSVTLDSNGTGQFFITYPKNRAYWVQVYLTATINVSGNQGTTTTSFVLPGLASDFNSATVAPPGQTSPYGTANSCANPN